MESVMRFGEPGYKKINDQARILIAEDEIINRMYLEMLMRRNHYDCRSAKSGIEVLEWVNKEHFDVILMDIGMPGMNGFDTSKRIRNSKNGEISEIPIIALTAHTTRQDRLSAKQAGMQGFIGKPFIERDVLSEVERFIGC